MSRSALYDDDVLLWSEQQADVIRRLGRTRRDLPNELDIENVAEEIESVGRSELASVESLLRLLLVHVIKIASVPTAPAISHWRDEARNFAAEALLRFAPSMSHRLDLERAWRLACGQANASLGENGDPVVSLPDECPFSISELIHEPLEVNLLVNRLAQRDQHGNTFAQ